MKIIDVHSHWGTKRGYPLQTPAEREQQKVPGIRRSITIPKPRWRSISATPACRPFSISAFRNSCRWMRPARCTIMLSRPKPRIATSFSGTGSISIRVPARRACANCAAASISASAFSATASQHRLSPPASDPLYVPFYKLCIEARIPVLIFVGTTGLGAGLPGGGGVILDDCHPRHLDRVAATYPDLKIVAARPGWPWQAETIAVLMHKRNIWYELHGWSPKYHTTDLRHEIPRRPSTASCSAPIIRCSATSGWSATGKRKAIPRMCWRGFFTATRRPFSKA